MFAVKQARVDALRRVPIFAGLPKIDLLELDRHMTRLTIDAGTKLARQGIAPREFVLITDGRAVVERDGVELATLGAGDSVGELSLLDKRPQTATVTAVEPSSVLVVATNEFRVMLDDSPGFAKRLLQSMAMRLRATDDLAVA